MSKLVAVQFRARQKRQTKKTSNRFQDRHARLFQILLPHYGWSTRQFGWIDSELFGEECAQSNVCWKFVENEWSSKSGLGEVLQRHCTVADATTSCIPFNCRESPNRGPYIQYSVWAQIISFATVTLPRGQFLFHLFDILFARSSPSPIFREIGRARVGGSWANSHSSGISRARGSTEQKVGGNCALRALDVSRSCSGRTGGHHDPERTADSTRELSVCLREFGTDHLTSLGRTAPTGVSRPPCPPRQPDKDAMRAS